MGIKGLMKALRELAPNSIGVKHLNEYKGQWVAIDAFNICYVNMSVAHRMQVDETKLICGEDVDHSQTRNKWLRMMRDYILKITEQGVAPLFVFDGMDKAEKFLTTNERKRKKNELIDEINLIKSKLQLSDSFDVLATNGSSNMNNVQKLSSLLKQVPYLTNEDIYAFQEILVSCGLPCLTAKGEGERLCSALCVYGYVKTVISSDSDTLTYGSPRVLISKGDKNNSLVFEEISINNVLYELDLDFKKFVDLCIMSGCDFNTNIPNIGIKKSLKLLQTYGNIEGIAAKHDITCLRHEICRDLFKLTDPKYLIEDDRTLEELLVVNKDFEYTRDVFARYELDDIKVNGRVKPDTDRLIKSIQDLVLVENNFRFIFYPQKIAPTIKTELVQPSDEPKEAVILTTEQIGDLLAKMYQK